VAVDANFANADLTGAVLQLTRIEGADLSKVKGLTASQLNEACGNEKTRLPQGLSPPASWPCRKS
jgi:uncharacterized protein YjbI with pentapeptide repeats